MTKSVLQVFFKNSVQVSLTASVNQEKVSVPKRCKRIAIEYCPVYTYQNIFKLSTNDDKIKQFPVIIEKIQFEDFWFIDSSKILLTPITNDISVEKQPTHNTLFFKGSLNYQFLHPLYKNFIKIY